jgi:hypothetical protein
MAIRAGRAHIQAKLLAWLDVAQMLPEIPAARRRIRRRIGGRELLELHRAEVSLAQLHAGGLVSLALPIVNAWFGGLRLLVARFAS